MRRCLDENEVVELVAGRLNDELRRSAECHLDECPRCLEWVIEWVKAQEQALTGDEARALAATTPAHAGAWRLQARTKAAERTKTKLGRYEIGKRLGAGGMGVVYRAFDPELCRHIALKVVARTLTSEAKLNAQLGEARALARLAHPNVVAVHDGGTDGEQVFIAMELIEGHTLSEWLTVAPRHWKEIVAIYREAARGMAAAHSAGVIHRDFKPENVLVGSGRVAVSDFGLACAVDRGEDRPGQPRVIAGTLPYMAPEQLEGKKADERTDIFNFCASLYQSLFGQSPFEGNSANERLAAICARRLRPLPPDVRIPRWLRATVLSGLSADPTLRPASMKDVIHALEHGDRRRRWAGAAALVGTTIIATSAVAMIQTYHSPLLSCRRHAAALRRSYVSTLRPQISAAFARSVLPFRDASWRSVDDALRRYAQAWSELYSGACEAAYERHTETVETLHLQFACLEERQIAFNRFGEVLSSGDPAVLTRAGTGVTQLDPVDGCANVALLSAPVPPPTDANARARIASARRALGDARGFEIAGQYDRAQASAAEALDLVHAPAFASYPPIEAEAWQRLGSLERARGHWVDAEKNFNSAFELAEQGRADDIRARAAIELVEVVGHRLGRFAEADRWGHLADLVLTRIGRPTRELASLAMNRGLLRLSQKRYDDAEADMRTSLALREQALPKDDPLIAITISNLAVVFDEKGRWKEAFDLYQDAQRRFASVLGDRHPRTLSTDVSLAGISYSLGQFRDARDAYQRALAAQEVLLGRAHPDVAATLANLASTLDELGDYAGAVEQVERALRIARTAGSQSLIAQLELNLAIYLMSTDDLVRAHQLLDSFSERWSNEKGLQGRAEYNLARLLFIEENDREAEQLAEQALKHTQAVYGTRYPLIASILDLLGEIACSNRRPDTARRRHQAALDIRGSDGSKSGMARTKLHLGVAELALGDVDQARSDLEAALLLCDEGDPRRRAVVSWALARGLSSTDGDRARQLRHDSSAVLRSAGRRFRREIEGMSNCLLGGVHPRIATEAAP
jgi:tetratricopeptide (TPR) repeat protein/tRNA A-37 threonylcarbamoyl transferase component Bud32